MNSFKTTLMGICTILVAVGMAGKAYFDNDPETVINIEATITAITAGVGLIIARDNSKTSEDAGAK